MQTQTNGQGPGLDAPKHCPKRYATLAARCALASVVLHRIEDDHGMPVYIATRWAMTKAFHDLNELAAWVDRVTGVKS